ncbi:hypothetical protein [Pelagicoccus sp. SDUM812002]|uniref:hypothetical protein n=1 Tax=Pelagicoccus sp. SDUM812002 TaxID=3041266 RepID=UPI00280D2892|nr:hypothetical protein [Pelagicoccus sp. SDUM812002]MDQ8186657.1 hypothetical protein [Pelagicoccus sp. SDUM812002]
MSTPEKPETKNQLPSGIADRKPWPMWPIALAIVLFMGVYTWINFEYRKEGTAFEPFQAMMDRKNAIVEKNFYDWYSIKTTRATEEANINSPASSSSREYEDALDLVIPEQLKYYMAGRPVLVPGFIRTESPDSLTPGESLPIRLHVPEPLATSELLNILTFYKEGELFILATLFVEKMEDVDPSLLQGEPTPTTFLIPTDPIAADSIKVSFINQDRLAEWQIQNLDPSKATVDEDREDGPTSTEEN